MENTELEKLLESLRQELQRAEGVDEKGLALLRDLDADIHHLMSDTEKAPASMLERWRESIEHFEVAYPALTTLLSELITSLSNAGI